MKNNCFWQKLKIHYLGPNFSPEQNPVKIKLRHIGCFSILFKDRNGHAQKFNKSQFGFVKRNFKELRNFC